MTNKASTLPRDLTAGLVVFLVALPLCLGVALASAAPADKIAGGLNVPIFSGLIAGIVGGILVGLLSGSQSSVSGPAAGLTAIVAVQVAQLGSFQAFLLAVMLAGVLQIAMGCARAGFLAAFFPSSVIKGLLAAIGVILIYKQAPYVIGYHAKEFHIGAAIIGVLSVIGLVAWDKIKFLKKSPVPAPLLIVLFGVALALIFRSLGGTWALDAARLVKVTLPENFDEIRTKFLPDFSQWTNVNIYFAAFTIAAVASLETLLNLQAVDKIDPLQRDSPPSRELWAQGVGNVVCGLTGGLPVTSVIVRSSVNINAGGRTKLSTVFHGVLLLVSVLFFAEQLNLIPLSCLAAILVVTGFKLASLKLVKQMWADGKHQFAPFAITVIAIVFTDLLVGVLIGLGVSLAFILWSNLRQPVRTIVEKHLSGEVTKIELANQVSFLNRAALDQALDNVPRGGHVLLDATLTDYIDPDVLAMIRDYRDITGPAREVSVSLLGFQDQYKLRDQIQFVDYSSRDLQDAMTPQQVLEVLKAGHARFQNGTPLTRDLGRQVTATKDGEHPLAVVLSCVDTRTPAELILDVGVGNIVSVRIAGNVTSRKVLGSVEYGCAMGAKLIVVMGHTRCGAVQAAVEVACTSTEAQSANLGQIVDDLRKSIDEAEGAGFSRLSADAKRNVVDAVARRNVARVVAAMTAESPALAELVTSGQVAIVGAMYDVANANLEFMV